MNNELFEALGLLEKEKGLSRDRVMEMLRSSIFSAVRAAYGEVEDIILDIDIDNKIFNVFICKTVVEEVLFPSKQISLEQAKEYDNKIKIDEILQIKVEPKDFGRIPVQNAKNTMRQNIRKEEKDQVFKDFQSRKNEITTGVVAGIDHETGLLTLEIGKTQATLLPKEQVPGEVLRMGDRVKVYVVDVKESEKHPKILISRTHSGFVKRLFEMEVPEISDGTVEIRSIAREAGSRTKMAVWSNDENVDPVGACIGNKGSRVTKIVDELNGEKVDVIKFSEDPAEFISSALSPASVVECHIVDKDEKTCWVSVPDHQQSLAIGNKGQNVRLAARLTGWKIDIRPESGFYGEEE